MKWPERPTCHGSSASRYGVWREPTPTRPPYGQEFRTCGYCGSIHPEDLIRVVEAGAKLGGSDWKYGWPHKFYVNGIPNPLAGQMVEIGSQSTVLADGTRHTEAIMGAASAYSHAKWYNEHLLDAGFDDEARAKLIDILKEHAGIEFGFNNGKLTYRAPHGGYQR